MASQNSQYSYLTLTELLTELSSRLNDPSNVLWSTAELTLYVNEALSFWNCLTAWWAQDYSFSLTPPLSSNWIFTNSGSSPRAQSLTDFDVYSIMLYHLLEPQLSSGAWAGTSQFNLADLTAAVQRRRDELLQASACNMEVNTNLSIPPVTSRIFLPDSVLDVRRVRYLGVNGKHTTLVKGDSQSFLRFSPGYVQQEGTPGRYDVLGSPPLALTFDKLASQSNNLEILAMMAGNTLDPPTPSPLQIPNDWMWGVKYGALADLFTNLPEATDITRARYCEQRWNESIQLMKGMPWLLNGYINNQAVDAPPVIGKDRYSYEWQENPNAWPGIVVGGVDLCAVCPIPTITTGVRLTLVGNAPQPSSDSSYVQVPRDAVDPLLDYCQHIASLKLGGQDFTGTLPLYQSFISYALDTSLRLRRLGIFATDLRPSVGRQDLGDPRFDRPGSTRKEAVQ